MVIVAIWSYNLNGNVRGNHTTHDFKTVEEAKAFLNEQYEIGNNGSWYSSEEEYQDVMFGEDDSRDSLGYLTQEVMGDTCY
jgi:hypothetical protein